MLELEGVLINTDILIDISRDNPKAVDFFEEWNKKKAAIFISIISAMELMVGARNKKEVKEIESFLNIYNILLLTTTVSHKAYELVKTYTKSHGLEIPDAFIAAGSISNDLNLATNNKKHFSMINGIQLLETY